jgi:hypothetical protein
VWSLPRYYNNDPTLDGNFKLKKIFPYGTNKNSHSNAENF